MLDLRSQQVAALEHMLRFNKDTTPQSEDEVVWKVLVFDTAGRDVISSVLRMSDLFKNGVTLHLMLNSERYPLPDVPAIYFVEPTRENIAQIGKDVAAQLYQSWSLNFVRPLTRDLLEDLAAKTLHSSQRIDQVVDQHLQFAVLEPTIFSLEQPKVYEQLTSPRTSEDDIKSTISEVVDGLFSMLMTHEVVPVIRASRGNAAEMVAQSLDEKLRRWLTNSRQKAPVSSPRPVLVILDRNLDLVSMFSHSWTYQSLINDTCEFRRNSVKVGQQLYDLDPSDTFWHDNQLLPFPEVAEHLETALAQYKSDAQKLTGKTDIGELDAASAHIKSALSALPELTARKQVIDMHMNILTVLLKAIGERGLGEMFQAEESAASQGKKEILELINKKEFVNPEDKLRLYLVFLIVSQKLSKDDQDEIEAALVEQGCELDAVKFVKRTKEISKMSLVATSSSSTAQPAAQPDLFKRLTGITSRVTEQLNQSGSLTDGFGSIIGGLRNFLPQNKDLPLTRIVQQLLDPQGAGNAARIVTEDYLYFDPCESRGSLSRPPKRQAHDEAIVFMVGGGNFYEYANVQDWASSQNPQRRVVYGATDMAPPKSFVRQCADLGRVQQ